MTENKTLDDILANYDDLKIVKSGFEILSKIDKTTTNHDHIYPTVLSDLINMNKLERYDKDSTSYKDKRNHQINNVAKLCRKLKELDLIIVEQYKGSEDLKRVYYSITEKGIELLAKCNLSDVEGMLKEMQPAIHNKQNEPRNRDSHNENIRALILKMIEEFPDVYESFVSLDPDPDFQLVYTGGKLSFENDVLYPDLEIHLGSFITFTELNIKLEEFKRGAVELYELHRGVKDLIQSELEIRLGLGFDQRCEKVNSFSGDLSDWVYNGLRYHCDYDNKKYFEHDFLDFEFHPKKTDESIRLRFGNGLMLNVEIGHASEKIGIVREFMGDIESSGSFRKFNQLIEKRKNFRSLRTDLLLTLEKESHVSTYPGKCCY